MISDRRKEKLQQVAAQRQQMTVILENVHDPHNIGAVMRTCDAVGIYEIFILYTDPRQSTISLKDLKTTSTGVKKWVEIHLFNDLKECFQAVRQRYDVIYATHLAEDALSIYESDLTTKVAFLFGNEQTGLTMESLAEADGNVLIPQKGMVQSLNISVACAVTLYEALRQRLASDMYTSALGKESDLNKSLFEKYIQNHEASYLRGKVKPEK